MNNSDKANNYTTNQEETQTLLTMLMIKALNKLKRMRIMLLVKKTSLNLNMKRSNSKFLT